MDQQIITAAWMCAFEAYLTENEKSPATREKYRRDVGRFAEFAAGRAVDKALVLAYKAELEQDYAVSSANSMLAALNAFFRFAGWRECCVKPFRVQRKTFCSAEKELTRAEYDRLIAAASKSIDSIANWNVGGTTTDISYMFNGCTALKTLDLSGWDVSQVRDMSWMFYKCGLTTLDLSGWNTGNVENMMQMFNDYRRSALDLSGWDVRNVIEYTNFSAGAIGITEPVWQH